MLFRRSNSVHQAAIELEGKALGTRLTKIQRDIEKHRMSCLLRLIARRSATSESHGLPEACKKAARGRPLHPESGRI